VPTPWWPEGRSCNYLPAPHLASLCGQQHLSSVAHHLFEGTTIITPETLPHVPQGVCNILLLVHVNTSAIYVGKPLPAGQDCIQKLQHNLKQHCLSPISSTFYNFEDMIVYWYRDLLLDGINSTNSTGEENHLFVAYGLTRLNNTA
jgi:hypothetical protein